MRLRELSAEPVLGQIVPLDAQPVKARNSAHGPSRIFEPKIGSQLRFSKMLAQLNKYT